MHLNVTLCLRVRVGRSVAVALTVSLRVREGVSGSVGLRARVRRRLHVTVMTPAPRHGLPDSPEHRTDPLLVRNPTANSASHSPGDRSWLLLRLRRA